MDTLLKSVGRLFPFALRAGLVVVGREALRRQHKQLQFVLVTTDLSANSLEEALHDFANVPIVQRYTPPELEQFFHVLGTKVLGFRRSPLARAIGDELKPFRIHTPAVPPPRPASVGADGVPTLVAPTVEERAARKRKKPRWRDRAAKGAPRRLKRKIPQPEVIHAPPATSAGGIPTEPGGTAGQKLA